MWNERKKGTLLEISIKSSKYDCKRIWISFCFILFVEIIARGKEPFQVICTYIAWEFRAADLTVYLNLWRIYLTQIHWKNMEQIVFPHTFLNTLLINCCGVSLKWIQSFYIFRIMILDKETNKAITHFQYHCSLVGTLMYQELILEGFICRS